MIFSFKGYVPVIHESSFVHPLAAVTGNVIIGKNCVIGQRCILKDNCKIQDGSILAPDTVVPPYTVFGGQPATYLGDLPESTSLSHANFCKTYYKNFIGLNQQGMTQ